MLEQIDQHVFLPVIYQYSTFASLCQQIIVNTEVPDNKHK